jgi:hypothetical protein
MEIATTMSPSAASRERRTLNSGRKTGPPIFFAGDPADAGTVCVTVCAFS